MTLHDFRSVADEVVAVAGVDGEPWTTDIFAGIDRAALSAGGLPTGLANTLAGPVAG